MALGRSAGAGASAALLAAGMLAAAALAEITNATGSRLDCTNDFEELVFCQFEAQNCARHNLTVRSQSGYGEGRCALHTCGTGRCCCSVRVGGEMLILGDSLATTVWKDAQPVESKTVAIEDSIKAKAPTITSLRENHGNFQLKWKTNVQTYLATQLDASVTYYRKGGAQKVTRFVDSATVDGLRYYEIPGRELEASATYSVSVRSYLSWSGRYSDSSDEWEFTTGASPHNVLLDIIISFSVFAVTATAVIHGCYVKLKTKWWDAVADPKLLMPRNDHKVLKPDVLVVSPVDVIHACQDESASCPKLLPPDTSGESTRQSSGISTGSSSLSYAVAEPADVLASVQIALSDIFPRIGPTSPGTKCHFLDSASSGSFDNRTYSIVMPSSPQQIACQPAEGDTQACAEQQVPACPLFSLPQASSVMPTEMSYHQCKADSAYADDSSLSSVSSSGNTAASCGLASRAEAGCDEADGGAANLSATDDAAVVCDVNPCYGRVPAGSRGFLPVDNNYQAFRNLVRQPAVWFPEGREHPDEHPEGSFAKIPPAVPGVADGLLGGRCLPELRRPLTSAMPPHRPIITNTGYQSV